MRKKRVLLIATNDLGKSGVPEVIMSIVRLLHDEFVFDAIITRDNTFYKSEFESYGGHVFLIQEKNYKTRLARIAYKLFGLQLKLRRNLKQIYANNYDVVHSFKDLEGGVYLKLAKKYKVPVRLSHCSRQYVKPHKLTSRLYDKYLLKKIFKYSSDLIAVSKRSGLSLYGANHQFRVLYNTYNEEKYSFNCTKKQNELVLTQIGTFLPIKNQSFSVKVFNEIIKQMPSAQLQLIGKIYDQAYYNEIIDFINDKRLTNNVKIYDYNIDQNNILEKTTFSMIPSLNEGLSLVAIESQAQGIKCFASKGVPNEVSCGGIEFLDFDIGLWSSKIIHEFKKTSGKRTKYNMEKFSNKAFKQEVLKLYDRP